MALRTYRQTSAAGNESRIVLDGRISDAGTNTIIRFYDDGAQQRADYVWGWVTLDDFEAFVQTATDYIEAARRDEAAAS